MLSSSLLNILSEKMMINMPHNFMAAFVLGGLCCNTITTRVEVVSPWVGLLYPEECWSILL